jgi:NitT/TauT family transport system substrate-binding protein
MRSRTARGTAVVIATAAALALAGCAGEASSPGDTKGPAETITIEVGTLPVIETALLMVGEEQGFFSKHNMKLNYNYAQGGAAIVPAVVSGQYQLGYSNSISVFQAMERGLPLSLLNVSAASNGNEATGTNDLVIRDDGSVTSVKDLEGKKVAVNTLGNLSDALARNAVDAGGGDSSKVTFVELGFGDMVPALKSGDIDAFLAGEPFGTIAKSQGYKTLVNTHQALSPNDKFIFGVWFVNTDKADKDPALYENLRQAIEASNKYANEHLDEVRNKVPAVTPMDAKVLAAIHMNGYEATLTPAGLKPLAAAAVKYGLLKTEPYYQNEIWTKP